jgi:hypothetical protein
MGREEGKERRRKKEGRKEDDLAPLKKIPGSTTGAGVQKSLVPIGERSRA